MLLLLLLLLLCFYVLDLLMHGKIQNPGSQDLEISGFLNTFLNFCDKWKTGIKNDCKGCQRIKSTKTSREKSMLSDILSSHQ